MSENIHGATGRPQPGPQPVPQPVAQPVPQPVPQSPRQPVETRVAATAKLALRDQLVTDRGRMSLALLADHAHRVAEHLLSAPEVRRAATVAAYVSVGREPGTGPLLAGLAAAGKRVILPLLLPDYDLDWAEYHGPESLAAARRGLLEPVGRALGVDAIGTADVVLVPGLAVDGYGMRMGRGGGSYDRALGRVPVGTFTCVVLNEAEVLPGVPTAAHDRPVTAAVTESGLRRFSRTL